jgi:two-component system, NarL family, nitrate/nitrite response regulator NarL
MSSVAGPPRVSRFGWSLAGSKGRDGKSDHPGSPTVLIATGDPDLRCRWRGVLHGPYPVRDVSARDCLERTIATLSPDVLLLDLDLLGVGGIGDGPIIRALARDTKVVTLSGVPNEREGIRVLKAGARGYCDRNVDPQLLRKVVDRIHDGEIWAERKLIPLLLEEYASHPGGRPETEFKTDDRLRLLTPREREIAFLIGGGASNKEIARRLRVGEGTVKAHLTAIFRKLGFSDRLQLGLFLVSPGVVAAAKTDGGNGPNGSPVDHFNS